MFEKIIEQIEKYDSIVLFGHIHPDGDCYGAEIALKELLLEKYPEKKVYAACSGLPDFFGVIAPVDQVSDETIRNSLAILLDSNDLSRSEDSRIQFAKAFAKIDHHVDLHTFTEGPEVIVDNANSTCELIVDFAVENNIKLSKIAANALYLGIVTDTARFQFCVDFAKVFDTCSWLISQGAEPYPIYEIVNLRSETYLKLVGYVYSHYQKIGNDILYMVFSRKEIEKFNEDTYTVANYVKLLSDVKGFKIALCFAEREDGKMVTEFRSHNYNVQEIAASHGGGGHIHASGVTLEKFSEENINLILNDCISAIKKEDN